MDEIKRELRSMSDKAMVARKSRCAVLHETVAALKRDIAFRLRLAKLSYRQFEQHTAEVMRQLDQQLLTLVLHYYATLEKELHLHDLRVKQEEQYAACVLHATCSKSELS